MYIEAETKQYQHRPMRYGYYDGTAQLIDLRSADQNLIPSRDGRLSSSQAE